MGRMPEIKSKEGLCADHERIFDAIVASRGGKMGPLTAVLFNSPEAAGRISYLGEYLYSGSSLPALDREIAVLTAARELDCEYEWSVHVESAPRAGVRQVVIDVIGHRRPLDTLTSDEALIVAYGRELLRDHRVSQQTFRAAKERYGNLGLTDLTATLGYYAMIACAFNAFEIEPQPNRPALP
ncbi:MAG: carboxymuconolactone decarboxylase family protein [Dehalococcoidia bacterium]|nr:carboxymuconolactone decarboxylase family protein [Dehalococcoidia bacterium]